MAGNPNMKPGAPSVNPGGRTREQRSAARQQARMIQERTGNGSLMVDFAIAVLLAGGEVDDVDADLVAGMAKKALKRFGLAPDQVTLRDRQWATEYLSDRGLGKPVVDVDITSDGRAVGSVSLLPIELPALTDEQLEAWRAKLRGAREAALEAGSPPGDGAGDPG